MTEKKSTLNTIEKIKAFAMALVGSGIFAMGTTYFSEQSTYRIPRILVPVYEIFGNIGLAIGMILIGGALLYFAFKKFKENGGKLLYLAIFSAIALIGFYVLLSTENKPMTADEAKAKIEENQNITQETIQNSERPNLDNASANSYLDKLEALEKKFEKAVNENNKTTFDECENEFTNTISVEYGKVQSEIATTSDFKDFALYNAKVLEKIQKYRTHQW